MSESVINKKDTVPILQVLIILALIAGIGVMGFLTVKKYMYKEPTVSPQEAEIKALTDAVNRNPSDLESRQKLAYAYQMLQQFDLAKEQYTETLKFFPNDLATNYNLGVIAKEEKNNPVAEKYLTKVLTIQPDHVLATLALGEVYLNQGKLDKVLSIADSALKNNDDIVDLHLLKARVYEKQGNPAKVKDEYNKVLMYVPDNKEALDGMAKLKK